jgi:hypothetical protein
MRRIDVVVVEYDYRFRRYLYLLLSGAGYAVTMMPTFEVATQHLRTGMHPAIVVVGNATPDNRLEAAFFATLAADASLAARHRCMLLTTTPEYVPLALRRQLSDLAAPIFQKSVDAGGLLTAVAGAAASFPMAVPALVD